MSFLTSCYNGGQKQSIITGYWTSENIKIGFVHANVLVEKIDSLKSLNGRISLKFQLDLKSDSTFILRNQNGKIQKGKYLRRNDSLLFTKDELPWIHFKIKEAGSGRLLLLGNRIFFMSDNERNIEFFTGENVQITLLLTSEN